MNTNTNKSERRRRIVIYRLGSLGDTVVALPCLHKVAQMYPDAERILLTNVPVNAKAAPLEAILGGSGLVHGYLSYPVGTRSITELSRLRTQLRALGADTLVYLTPSRGLPGAWRDLLFFRLCGFRHIAGAPLSRDLQRHRRGTDGRLERECERLARCLATLGAIDLDDRAAWDLHLSAGEREAAAAALGAAAAPPRIAINMGGKVLQNDWGEANWQALVTHLRHTCADHALVIVGAAEDEPRATRIGKLWPGPVANLCGRVSPRVSAAAMAGARVFVGHDSGPLHLAACVGVPCVGLYGDYHEPRKWHPHGEQHRILHEMKGVQAIDVETVALAVLAELAVPSPVQAALVSAA
jgi:heptosyltransferase III